MIYSESGFFRFSKSKSDFFQTKHLHSLMFMYTQISFSITVTLLANETDSKCYCCVAVKGFNTLNPYNAFIFLYKPWRPKGFLAIRPSVPLSAFGFWSKSRKPIGRFLSYCTHTFIRGCRCAFYVYVYLLKC